MHTLVQLPQMVVAKRFAACCAGIRPLLCVYTHVVAQQRALDKATAADCTDVRTNISVNAFVNIQRAMLRELAATKPTGVGTLARVPSHVHDQRAPIAETFTARQAGVRRITGMQLKMLPILLEAYESTSADSTTVRRRFLFLCHSDTSPYTVMFLKLLCR